ncbi:hypothetical protein [Sphaerisporangium sp. NPDC051011]|uniref:hypothetical protein n=1 Tax=Sphaerisporangium sp. NPDC051011 TaxID=3155792 RepID=UPI00340FDCFD
MPYKTKTARYERALPLLTTARDDVRKALAEAHPAGGCLPIPPIEVPAADAVREAVDAMCESLWVQNGAHRHPDWVTARTACTHMLEQQVLNVYELLVEWYRKLIDLHYYVDNIRSWSDWGRLKRRHSLDCRVRVVAEFPGAVASAGGPLTGRELDRLNRQLREKVWVEVRPS